MPRSIFCMATWKLQPQLHSASLCTIQREYWSTRAQPSGGFLFGFWFLFPLCFRLDFRFLNAILKIPFSAKALYSTPAGFPGIISLNTQQYMIQVHCTWQEGEESGLCIAGVVRIVGTGVSHCAFPLAWTPLGDGELKKSGLQLCSCSPATSLSPTDTTLKFQPGPALEAIQTLGFQINPCETEALKVMVKAMRAWSWHGECRQTCGLAFISTTN